MGKIIQLELKLQNMIAAGEVVERISNVVKELVENSLDANADKIEVILEESGMKRISVIDNGFGMDKDDALLAFMRHATSKIKTEYDLFHINSLGFRGEALPSIAAVSRVELATATKGSQGFQVIYQDGDLLETNTVPPIIGTSVKVTRLFYHTPARFKYLKSPQTELANIQDLVNKFALSYPSVAFRLENNDRTIFQTSGNDRLPDVFAKIYGLEVAKSMRYFSGNNRDYRIQGYFSNPIHNRSSKNYMTVVVNKRPVKDTRILGTISDSFDQLIPLHRYPIVYLEIDVDPQLIDVNVHPTKLEIKFSEADFLAKLIFLTLQKALELAPVIQDAISEKENIISQTKIDFIQSFKETDESLNANTLFETADALYQSPFPAFPDFDYIGQYLGTYLLFQNIEGLYLLDQHAAAERIRYEKYLEQMSRPTSTVYELLVPMQLDLSNEQALLVDESIIQKLSAFGIRLSKLNTTGFSIDSVPSWFPKGYEVNYAETIVSRLSSGLDIEKKNVRDELAKLLSCKHSLKANQYVNHAEAESLIKKLRQCKNPYTCPHGRPILVLIAIGDIEKWFKRIMS